MTSVIGPARWFRVGIHSGAKDFMKPLIWICAGVLAVVVLSFGSALILRQEYESSKLSRSDIRREVNNVNSGAVLKFVRDYAANPGEKENVLFAIDESIKNGAPAMIGSMEDLYFDKAIADDARAHVLDDFIASHKAMSNSTRLLDAVAQADTTGDTFGKLVAIMRRTPVSDRISLVTTRLLSSLDANSCDSEKTGQKALQLAKSIVPERVDDLSEIQSAYEKATDSQCKLQDLQDTVESRNSDIEQQAGVLGDKPFLLTGYIVGEHPDLEKAGVPVYEITVSSTGKRALLYTTTTRFQSQGFFRLMVTRFMDMGVQVKPEFGSFNQTWKTYFEDSQEDVDRRGEAREKIKGYKREIQEAQAAIASLNGDLPLQKATYNQRLCAFETAACTVPGQ